MKKCPHCAEEIQEEAKKCKHCGESLVGETTSAGRILGALFFIGGIGAVALALNMDTSVEVRGLYGEVSRVHNLSLANQQQTYLMMGGIVAMLGLILAAMKRKS